MKFVSLHHHTSFSYQDGHGMPESHIDRAAELGMGAIAVTEHGNVTSHVKLEKAAILAGIQPIFGCELYCEAPSEDETRSRKKNHLTVLAETQDGYQNLLRLISTAWAEGFYFEPTVSGSMLNKYKSGLIILSGCTGSLLATSLIGGKTIPVEQASFERGKKVARQFQKVFGESYFLEVQAFPTLSNVCTLNAMIERLSKELKIPMVATLDVHYTKPNDSELQEILHNTRGQNKKTDEDKAREWSYDVKLTPPISDKSLLASLCGAGLSRQAASQALANTAAIAERCKGVSIPKLTNIKFPLPPGVNDAETQLRKKIVEGWRYRNIGSKKNVSEYKAQLKYELDQIVNKKFEDYFLLVNDVMVTAKDVDLIACGPGRGSSAASLICYLLRITEVDPVQFPNLMFERFIDINRADLPDIDMDFDDEYRWKVRARLVEKFGEERVGSIATFTRYKGKNSLEDVQRSRYPDNYQAKEAVEKIKSLLITRADGEVGSTETIQETIELFPEVRELFDKFPELYKAARLEGNVKGMSVHAAGVIVANEALTNTCAVYTRVDRNGKVKIDPNSGLPMQVVSIDMRDAEILNVMKLDILGLKTMGMINYAAQSVGMSMEDIYKLSYEFPNVYEGFCKDDVVGIFQFDGGATRDVNLKVQPKSILELSDINALSRPGPQNGGATDEYIAVKRGKKATHFHEIMDMITEPTYFQIVYQEQIMRICQHLGNFPAADVTAIRKLIGKSKGSAAVNRMRDQFVDGAKTHGCSAVQANKIFDMMATAGAYAFNFAHSLVYSLIAYWTMWLKVNHPAEFYAASCRKAEGPEDKDRLYSLLQDAKRHDIPILPLSFSNSDVSWSVDDRRVGNFKMNVPKGIRPGFLQVPGIGKTLAPAIVEARNARPHKRFEGPELAMIPKIGPKKVETIIEFMMADDPFMLNALTIELEDARKKLANGELTDGFYELPAPTHMADQIPAEITPHNFECVWLGRIVSKKQKDMFETHRHFTGETLDPTTVKRPDLKESATLYCEDETGQVTVSLGRFKYPNFKETLWNAPDKVLVLVKGAKFADSTRRSLFVNDMWILTDG
jgi:DNA polymerase-3 subunit alpha